MAPSLLLRLVFIPLSRHRISIVAGEAGVAESQAEIFLHPVSDSHRSTIDRVPSEESEESENGAEALEAGADQRLYLWC